MKYSNKINTTSFFVLLFLLFSSLNAEWQPCDSNNSAELPHIYNDSAVKTDKYDSRVYITTESGDNWKNVTIGISSYYYGFSLDNKKADKQTAGISEFLKNNDSGIRSSMEGLNSGFPENMLNENTLNEKTLNEKTLKENESVDIIEKFGSMQLTSYLVKITKYIKYSISNKRGNESVNVSREKLTQGLYNFRVNGSDAVKTFNYYKLETEKGTFKKEWFS